MYKLRVFCLIAKLNILYFLETSYKLSCTLNTNCQCSYVVFLQGDDQRDKWLLFLRVEGHEYDASFANARFIASKSMVPGNRLGVCEIDDIVCTVDDIAEGGGEIAALATLMYAPMPFEDCLCSGSIIRHSSSSAQCTLENLRPALQRFPTLWKMLVTACFGQDPTCSYLNPTRKGAILSSGSTMSFLLYLRLSVYYFLWCYV